MSHGCLCEHCGDFPSRAEADFDGATENVQPAEVLVHGIPIARVMACRCGNPGWAIVQNENTNQAPTTLYDEQGTPIRAATIHPCKCGGGICSRTMIGDVAVRLVKEAQADGKPVTIPSLGIELKG